MRAPVNLELWTYMEQVQQHAVPQPLNAVTDHPFSQNKTWTGRRRREDCSLAPIFTTHINVWCSDCQQVCRTKSRSEEIECTSCISVMRWDETPFYQQRLKKKRGMPARQKLNKGGGLTDRSSCYENEHIQSCSETKLAYSQLSQQFPIPRGLRLSGRIQK